MSCDVDVWLMRLICVSCASATVGCWLSCWVESQSTSNMCWISGNDALTSHTLFANMKMNSGYCLIGVAEDVSPCYLVVFLWPRIH